MAEYRQMRAVAQHDPDLDQAMIPYLPPHPLGQGAENQVVALENSTRKHPQSSKSTRVLAVVQRPRDQIILTEDDKGKQMVIQRSHNVAKIQRRQRNENFKPSDLRLRGKQRPVAVGVVGSVDAADPEQALWRARQIMQNVQSQRSDQHRPLQEEEERRIAEEVRLRALAKNEKKMRSYGVDMGNNLENNDSSTVSLQHNSNHDQLDDVTGYELLDEYLDDEVYDQDTANDTGFNNLTPNHEANKCDGPNIKAKQDQEPISEKYDCEQYTNDSSSGANNSSSDGSNSSDQHEDEEESEEGENNDFLGDEQSLVEYEDEEDLRQPMLPHPQISRGALRRVEAEERNRVRMLEIRQRQQRNMEQVIDNTAQAREQEARRKAEVARQKALQENEKKMKSYRVTTGFTLGSAVNPGASVQHTKSSSAKQPNIANYTTSVQRASSSSIRRPSITKSTSSIASNPQEGSPARVILSKEEREKRRQEENKQKMLAAREKQQQNYARLLEETAEKRRQEEERKAEEARLKALEKNSQKMKSYKMTLGYSLEDYLQDSAPCIDNSGGEQASSTMHAHHSNTSVDNSSCRDNTKGEQLSSTIHTHDPNTIVDNASCIDNTEREQLSSTMHAHDPSTIVDSASSIDNTEREQSSSTLHGQYSNNTVDNASCMDKGEGEQSSNTMHAQYFDKSVDSTPFIDISRGEQSLSTIRAHHSNTSVGSASCIDNTEGEQASSTMHAQYPNTPVDNASCIDYSEREKETPKLQCVSPRSSPSVNESEQAVCNTSQASAVDSLERAIRIDNEEVTDAMRNGASDVQFVVEDKEEEELTEEQKMELFREQMRAARLKKLAMDRIIAKNEEVQRR